MDNINHSLNNSGQPLIYFARAMDEMDEKEIINLSKIVKTELTEYNLKMIDPYFENPENVEKRTQKNATSTTSIVDGDLLLLRKSDAVLMDMSIPERNYIGCSCELVYANLWKIPVIVYVGCTGNDKRHWLQYHATKVCAERTEAIKLLAKIVRKVVT